MDRKGSRLAECFTLKEEPGRLIIGTARYLMQVDTTGCCFSFHSPDREVIAAAHEISGIRFSSPNGEEVHDALSAALVSFNESQVHICVTNRKGDQADVRIEPSSSFVKLQVLPRTEGRYTIDARTAPLQPVYGLGDHGGYGDSTDVFGITDNHFLNANDGKRFVSNFAVFPASGFAQVLFEDGVKRVRINGEENALGASGVTAVSSLYYFIGPPEQIYMDYKLARHREGYPDLKPKYDFFEVGYEAFGSLGWNTYQQSVQEDLQAYIDKGYRLKWAVIGSGFWKGDRQADDQGATTSFGIWDDEYEEGRADGLPNPRYPDKEGLKDFFHSRGMKLILGLRISFKALPEHGGHYNALNDGNFIQEGLERGYFVTDEKGSPITYRVQFPKGAVYLLDARKPDAVNWYSSLARLWGADGFKEDTMLKDGALLRNDAKCNATNAKLMEAGYYSMVRNAAYSVPGEILRLEDTMYGMDQDRPAINGLNYAASGASNVYVDIIAGKYLKTPLTEDQKIYFVRNAMFAAVFPAMSVGLGPWKMNHEAYEGIVKKACDWHSAMAPYIYSAALDSFHSGYPHTMTPLPIAYPTDTNTYGLASKQTKQYEWMLGPSLLAAPAYGSDYAQVTARDVYLPEGKWIDFETGAVYYGPVTLKGYELPPDKIPVFIGGKGVIVVRDEEDGRLYAEVYPIRQQGSQYRFRYPDGKHTSCITNDNTGWNPDTLEIVETESGDKVSFRFNASTGACRFRLREGANYRLVGGMEGNKQE
ncbi:TIM-barrel domain-containing protein [Paenibacillus silviterrae]|uniref:TIM-barrel domain-containing protein n=1 Tax=Paenibacillus silviterrae TaxID=3242194 RepID=UPI0025438F3D|nr:TIM-barrel domain-containing protein [Paenibacillus chinjuensis]